jgi:uncharacterized membrane protein
VKYSSSAIPFLLSGLLLALSSPVHPARAQTATPEAAVVHAVMFWKAGCHHCEQTISVILPPIHERYGSQFELFMVQVITDQDVQDFYRLSESYEIPRYTTGVPFLIIDDHVLIGTEQIHAQLPGLIDDYLAQGGVSLPANEILTEILATHAPVPIFHLLPATAFIMPTTIAPATSSAAENQSNGFGLATTVIIGISIVLAYTSATMILPSLPVPAGRWLDGTAVILILVGLGVASYLAYIEIESANAICGPVGDCNTVQSSPYARLFGMLPIGVLGVIGYILLLVTLGVRRTIPFLHRRAGLVFFAMAYLGTAFSLYLTYLERFVIQAICIWCIASAITMTLILLCSIAPLRETQFRKEKQNVRRIL